MTKPVRVLEGGALAFLLFASAAVAAVLEKLGRELSETFSLAP
jgi:hypothetical protein